MRNISLVSNNEVFVDDLSDNSLILAYDRTNNAIGFITKTVGNYYSITINIRGKLLELDKQVHFNSIRELVTYFQGSGYTFKTK